MGGMNGGMPGMMGGGFSHALAGGFGMMGVNGAPGGTEEL